MNNALNLFKSATLRLTVWYVCILMAICVLFSVIIFSITSLELNNTLISIQQAIVNSENYAELAPYQELREAQIHQAQNNLVTALLTTNIAILAAGSVGSFYLAKRSLRPIEEAHEAQSRFTSDASHELRTPLASMKIELEVALRDEQATKPELRAVLESNLEEVNRLTKLSHNLLQLSRLEHDGIATERVNLFSTAKLITKRFQDSDRISISGLETLYVRANQSSVEELLTILVDNAIKYSPPKSPLTLTIVRRRQMAGYRVTNEGEGIESAALPYIFDRFYRTDRSRRSDNHNSYGLGLSLAKKIIEMHDGDLSVSSAKNAPTTFLALLPIAQKPSAKRRPKS